MRIISKIARQLFEVFKRYSCMKLILSILLKCILLFVFTTLTTTSMWACGKHHTKKEMAHHPTKCQKDCCKKDSKNKKKGCCGDDDCICSVSTTVLGDLPQQLYFDIVPQRPVFVLKRAFFYQQAFPKSSIQDIWQPPISVLSV